MIPRTSLHAQNTEQFFDIALEIFRSIDENDREELPLARYILDWSDLLFSRENDKVRQQSKLRIVILTLCSLLVVIVLTGSLSV